MQIWSQIASCMSDVLGTPMSLNSPQSIGGGCVNQAWKVNDQHKKSWFVKMNQASKVLMFQAEMAGLNEIINTQSIRAPAPLCVGSSEQYSFLVMEYLNLSGSIDREKTGEQLANMHAHAQPQFGWYLDNTIGTTPQINRLTKDWLVFWGEHRLLYQLQLALSNGFSSRVYDKGLMLIDRLNQFFEGYQPIASLLHGDLWAGNCSANEYGNPVIYDPAIYYGDRETDLAMTELFGGFGDYFMKSYNEYFPIHEGYQVRKVLYNLYHILNHYNLFGGGYDAQAGSMIDSLLSEVR